MTPIEQAQELNEKADELKELAFLLHKYRHELADKSFTVSTLSLRFNERGRQLHALVDRIHEGNSIYQQVTTMLKDVESTEKVRHLRVVK